MNVRHSKDGRNVLICVLRSSEDPGAFSAVVYSLHLFHRGNGTGRNCEGSQREFHGVGQETYVVGWRITGNQKEERRAQEKRRRWLAGETADNTLNNGSDSVNLG